MYCYLKVYNSIVPSQIRRYTVESGDTPEITCYLEEKRKTICLLAPWAYSVNFRLASPMFHNFPICIRLSRWYTRDRFPRHSPYLRNVCFPFESTDISNCARSRATTLTVSSFPRRGKEDVKVPSHIDKLISHVYDRSDTTWFRWRS